MGEQAHLTLVVPAEGILALETVYVDRWNAFEMAATILLGSVDDVNVVLSLKGDSDFRWAVRSTSETRGLARGWLRREQDAILAMAQGRVAA